MGECIFDKPAPSRHLAFATQEIRDMSEASIYQAVKGLTSNIRRIDPKSDPVARNQTKRY
jgi:hypothetical protein